MKTVFMRTSILALEQKCRNVRWPRLAELINYWRMNTGKKKNGTGRVRQTDRLTDTKPLLYAFCHGRDQRNNWTCMGLWVGLLSAEFLLL